MVHCCKKEASLVGAAVTIKGFSVRTWHLKTQQPLVQHDCFLVVEKQGVSGLTAKSGAWLTKNKEAVVGKFTDQITLLFLYFYKSK